MSKNLKDLLGRAEGWPEEAQEELVAYGRELENAIGGDYLAMPDELAGIDRGIEAADKKAFVLEERVRKLFTTFGQS